MLAILHLTLRDFRQVQIGPKPARVPVGSIETRSLPTLTRSSPCRFTFYVADPRGSIQFFAADTAATTAIQLMHRKRLMIGKFPDDARWRADDAMASALITCHDE
jgi:hypothetical protein